MRALFALALAVFSSSSWSQVEIERPWIRATAPGVKIAAGYLTVHNKSAAPERLVGGASPAAERVETHVHIKDGNILRMREVKGYDVPAQGSLELKPGGAHLMLIGVKQPLKEGDSVPVTLRFERAGEITVNFPVGRLAAPPLHHKH